MGIKPRKLTYKTARLEYRRGAIGFKKQFPYCKVRHSYAGAASIGEAQFSQQRKQIYSDALELCHIKSSHHNIEIFLSRKSRRNSSPTQPETKNEMVLTSEMILSQRS